MDYGGLGAAQLIFGSARLICRLGRLLILTQPPARQWAAVGPESGWPPALDPGHMCHLRGVASGGQQATAMVGYGTPAASGASHLQLQLVNGSSKPTHGTHRECQ